MQQSTSGQRRRSVLKREGGGGELIFHSAIYALTSLMFQMPFNFALFVGISKPHCNLTVSSVGIIRPSCFIVLLRQFLSRLRAVNVCSKVAYVTGIVKYIFKRVFRHQNEGGGGLSSPICPCSPCTAAYVSGREMWRKDSFGCFIYIYILNFAGNSTCFVARML